MQTSLVLLEKTEIVSRLRELKGDIQRRYKAVLLGLFGSFARDEQHEASDLDILVRFEPDASLLSLSGLTNFLQAEFDCRVDIADESTLRETYKPFIYRDLIPV